MAAPLSADSTYQYTPLASPTDLKQEFRLLILLPGQDGTQIECELEHAIIESPPPFEALSYTWGDPKGPRCEIPCQGDLNADYYIKLHGKAFRVGYNLMSALQNLRLEGSPRTLWADAVCINQVDNEEKSHQVMAMSKIYTSATRVLAWLGEADAFTDLAFDTIEELCWVKRVKIWRYCSKKLGKPNSAITKNDFYGACLSLVLDPPKEFRKYLFVLALFHDAGRRFFFEALWSQCPNDTATADFATAALDTFGTSRSLAQQLIDLSDESFGDMISSKAIHASIQTFTFRNYWWRLWVVQELELSKDALFMCGKRHLTMNDFHTIFLIYYTVEKQLVSMGPNVIAPSSYAYLTEFISKLGFFNNSVWKFENSVDSFGWKRSLHTSLQDTTGRACADPRDKVYAVLSVSAAIDISVDYSLSTGEVYADATSHIIDQEESLDVILSYTSPSSIQINTPPFSLPSWTPRFDVYQRRPSPLFKPIYFCGGRLDTKRDVTNLCTLKVEGYAHGMISKTFDAWGGSEPEPVWDILNNVRYTLFKEPQRRSSSMLGIRKQLGLLPPHQDALAQGRIFWTTLVTDTYPNANGVHVQIAGNPELERAFAGDVAGAFELAPPNRLIRRLEKSRKETMFCLTSDGKMASVFGRPQKGDEVFLAKGASMPIIIRRVPGQARKRDLFRKKREDAQYTLVGAAYIYEYMDGKFMDGLERSDRKRDRVTLI